MGSRISRMLAAGLLILVAGCTIPAPSEPADAKTPDTKTPDTTTPGTTTPGTTTPDTTTPDTTTPASAGTWPGSIAEADVGDCLVNTGTAEVPVVVPTPCTAPDALLILKVVRGEQIREGPDDQFNQGVTAVAMCSGTGYQLWYGVNYPNDAEDQFFCLTRSTGRSK